MGYCKASRGIHLNDLCFIHKWKGSIFLIKPYFRKNILKFFFITDSNFKWQFFISLFAAFQIIIKLKSFKNTACYRILLYCNIFTRYSALMQKYAKINIMKRMFAINIVTSSNESIIRLIRIYRELTVNSFK